jgi:hypothetical protein
MNDSCFDDREDSVVFSFEIFPGNGIEEKPMLSFTKCFLNELTINRLKKCGVGSGRKSAGVFGEISETVTVFLRSIVGEREMLDCLENSRFIARLQGGKADPLDIEH